MIGAAWVRSWQRYTYFDCIDGEMFDGDGGKRERPEKIDCSSFAKSEHSFSWTDVQVMERKRDGYDFIVIDKKLKEAWVSEYGQGAIGPVERRGIDDNDGMIEFRLKTVRWAPIPNTMYKRP